MGSRTCPGQGEVLGRTTTDDGADWKWVVVQPVAGQMMSPTLVGDGRRPPHGVQAAHVNWICIPPNADAKWVPAPGEAMVLIRDATVLLSQLQAAGPGSYAVNVAGAPGSLEEVTLGVPNPPAEGAGSGGPGVAALGLGGDQVNNPGSSQLDLKALEAAVAQLQALSLKDPVKGKKRERKGRRTTRRRNRRRARRRKNEDLQAVSSSSRSRSRSSASSTSSSSSTDSGKRKPLRWKEKGRDRRVSYEDLAHVDGLKWKKKGDLIAFAMKNPGALTGHFLAGVYARLSEGHPCADVPAERCFGSSLGASVHGLDRGAGSEGSLNLGRDLGFGEPPGDRPSYGHPLPEDPCHPGRKAQGGFMGEGGVRRAGQHAAVPCQHLDAGFDERLVGHFRRAWRLPADGGEEGSIGFGEFFLVQWPGWRLLWEVGAAPVLLVLKLSESASF